MQYQMELMGITKNDIQEIFENTIKSSKIKPSLIFLDANYLYTFHLDDFEYVRKFNILGRYDINAVKQWHRCLERWYQDQTVTVGGKIFKPIQISRTLDRVVNEGLEIVAGCITGQDSGNFEYRGIGDGEVVEASPSDRGLGNLIDIINVNDNPDGGSLSRDGSTIYSVGNHSKAVETPANQLFTESGMFDSSLDSRNILDHSVFESPIQHIQNADSPGSTTVIYMCSS